MSQQRFAIGTQDFSNRLAALGWAIDARLALAGDLPAIARRAKLRRQGIVRWARTASPLYRELYRGIPAGHCHFTDLPPVTKPQLMARFDEWVTDPNVTLADLQPWLGDLSRVGSLYRGKYLAYTTSGTTGEPAVLVQDHHALSLYLASRVRMYPVILDRDTIARVAQGRGRSAALLATGGHYGGVVMAEWARRLHPLGRNLEIFSVAAPLTETVAGLNRLQPVIISGYASAIALLAEEAASGRLAINPALIFSIAEGLTPAARDRIDAVWDTRVIEGYGASEAAVIAFGCREGNLHQNVDWVTLEPVDTQYRPVPDGTPSYTALVTNLANRVQPIVRYDLGDSVTVDPRPCRCGNPLPVIRVEGRSGDILALARAGGEIVRILPLAIGSEAEEVAGVRRVQIVQVSPAELVVKIEPEAGANREGVEASVRQQLEAFLARQGLANVAVSLSHDPPQQERSGKFRQVYRQSPP